MHPELSTELFDQEHVQEPELSFDLCMIWRKKV